MKLLKVCHQIELKTGELYKLWSQQDQHPPELLSIWKRLAFEEEQHANEIQLALKLATENAVNSIRLDEKILTQALDHVNNLIAETKQNPIAEKRALQEAYTIESSLHEAHLIQSIEFADPSMKKLFAALSSGDKSHYETLKGYLTKNGYIKNKSNTQ